MTITSISTDAAPSAIGPYSQAVTAGDTLYISGQIPLDPVSGNVIQGDVAAQTRQVLENLKAIVTAAGGTLSSIAKVTIYLTDMDQFAVVNGIYGEYFSAPYPARACVEVTKLPKGADVEMDAVALLTG